MAAWESLCAASRGEHQEIYNLLNIQGLNERGEKFHNPYLKGVVDELESQDLAMKSEGTTVVFLDGYLYESGWECPSRACFGGQTGGLTMSRQI